SPNRSLIQRLVRGGRSSNEPARTRMNARMSIVAALAIATQAAAQGGMGPVMVGPGGPGGRGGVQEDRPIVKQFDANDDKRLDAAERKAAREWMATNGGGMMGPGGPGGGQMAPGGPGG